MTCFVIKISLYGVESDAKRVTKKGKRGQNVMWGQNVMRCELISHRAYKYSDFT